MSGFEWGKYCRNLNEFGNGAAAFLGGQQVSNLAKKSALIYSW
jgi:hypothetical protein